MSKYRVYELAKEYNTLSKVIIDILSRNNIVAKNHMSSVDDQGKAAIDRAFARKTGAVEAAERPVPKPAPVMPQPRPAERPPTASVPQDQRGQFRNPAPGPRPAGQSQQPYSGNRPYSQPHQGQRPAQVGGSNPNFRPSNPTHASAPNSQSGAPNRAPGQITHAAGPSYQQGPRRPAPVQGQSQGMQQTQGGQGPRPNYGYQQRPPYQNRPGENTPAGQGAQQSFRSNQGSTPGGQPRPGYQGNQPRPGGNYPPRTGQGPNQGNFRPGQGAPGAGQGNYRSGQAGPGNRPQGAPRPGMGPGGPRPASPAPAADQSGRPAATGNKFAGGARPANRTTDYSKRKDQERSLNKGQQHRGRPGQNRHGSAPSNRPEPPRIKNIKLGGPIAVNELASKMGRESGEVIKKLLLMGVMATINQEVDFDTAVLVAGEFGVTVEELPPEEDPTEIREIEDDPETLKLRPPVVTVMGHVDHGKTSLLDAIRQTHVTAHEAGGITQHIGAYQVNYQGKKIVFLDTPGHEAFTAMRARGAQVTDIAILVVAADDGVMPQTIEAINHAKAAKVPVIVAINKMDRPNANPEHVKQQLSEHGLIPEDWGGDTIMVPVSAYKKTGITDLLEMVLLVAEVQDIKANPNRPAQGTIIEAQLDKGRGPVATVLVQKGTLNVGDTIIAGTAFGKVRAMINDRGEKVKKAEPSIPVEVLGLSDVPMAGDILNAVEERVARAVAEKRVAKKRTEDIQPAQKVSLDDLFKQIQEGNLKDLNIVVKADVQGSIEALRQALVNLKNKEVRVSIVHAGVGAINETDVMLASAANALIIGFNVRPDTNARKMAEAEKVDLRMYRVIYDAINDVEAALTGMLAPEFKEVQLGRVEVRQVISVPKGVVAGSYVLEGKITNSSQVRIVRNGIVVHEGHIESLRRFKDDVKEVAAGYECGITIEKFRDVKEGDIIEAFTMEEVKRGS